MRTHLLLVVAIGGSLAGQLQADEEKKITATLLDSLAEEGLRNNPGQQASRSRSASAGRAPGAIRVWENPEVSFGKTIAEREMRADDGDLVYGVQQTLPTSGRGQAEVRLAEAAAARETARVGLAEQQFRIEVERQALRFALAAEQAELNVEDARSAESLERALQDRIATGLGQQPELLRAGTERMNAAQRVRTGALEIDQQRFALNQLLGREVDASAARLRLPEPAARIVFTPAIGRALLANEAEVILSKTEAAEAAKVVEVTRAEARPDVTIGAEARQFSGSGEFREGMITASVSLPWANASKYRAAVERDRLKANAALLEVANAERKALAVGARILAEVEAARSQAVLSRDQLIPQAQLALETERANWVAGNSTLTPVLEARRAVTEARRTYHEAVARQYEGLAELIRCCGLESFDALERLGSVAGKEEAR